MKSVGTFISAFFGPNQGPGESGGPNVEQTGRVFTTNTTGRDLTVPCIGIPSMANKRLQGFGVSPAVEAQRERGSVRGAKRCLAGWRSKSHATHAAWG
jgi:hypothetical protein